MKRKIEPSNYDLLKGKMNFTNQPYWFQLFVMLIMVIYHLGALALKGWIILASAAKGITGIKLDGLLKLFKTRSP